MGRRIGSLRDSVSTTLTQTHQNLRTHSSLGHAYTFVTDEITPPVWNAACKVNSFLRPKVSSVWQTLAAHARARPYVTVLVGGIFCLAFIHVVVRPFRKRDNHPSEN